MNRIEREVYAELENAARAALLLLQQLGPSADYPGSGLGRIKPGWWADRSYLTTRLDRALESVYVIHTREKLSEERRQERQQAKQEKTRP